VHFSFADGRVIADWPHVIELPVTARDRMLGLLQEMLDEWRQRPVLHQEVTAALFVRVLATYCRHAGHVATHEPVGRRTDRHVQRALAYMQQHIAGKSDVAEIAKNAGLSTAYFCRVFRQYTGHSPHEYLIRMRLEKAKELLYDPQMNCSLAALRSGFSSVHLFSRAFRRYEGQTPTQWIANHLR
jgi:AraC family transcriptional regulator